MAYFTVKFNSTALNRPAVFDMFIPNDHIPSNAEYAKRPMKTLYLLHGYSMSGWNWVPQPLAEKYNFAVVAPSGDNSFWLDGAATGRKYCTFVGKELPDYVTKTFGLSDKPEDNAVLGLSMGGFGALHTALKYPERFGMAGAMSSALIVHEVAKMKSGDGNGHANYDYYRECFGEPSEVLNSESNPEFLVDKLLSEGKKFPEIYMSCGTEDFLLNENRAFHKFLDDRGVAHEYIESAGNHNFDFWNEYTAKFIEKMFS